MNWILEMIWSHGEEDGLKVFFLERVDCKSLEIKKKN